MARINNKVVWWAAVAQAAEYRVRIVPDGQNQIDYTFTPQIVVAHIEGTAEFEADLSTVNIQEGVHDVYVTSVDVAGNESDPLVLADAFLDFTPPNAPAQGGIR